jgi:hypothetical protein
MRGFLELQEAIYRAHRLIRSGSDEIRGLSADEREAYELRVKVTPGSSTAAVDLQEILTRLGVEAVSKMGPVETTISLISIALLIAGSLSWKQWLDYKLKAKQAELAVEEKSKALDAQKELMGTFGQISKDQVKLLETAIHRNAGLRKFKVRADNVREEFIKQLPAGADVVDIGGGKVNAEAGREITRNTRKSATTEIESVECYVLKLDKTGAEGTRVRLRYADTDFEITAGFRDRALSSQIIDALDKAFWDNKVALCEIEFRRVGERLVDATVMGVVVSRDAAE